MARAFSSVAWPLVLCLIAAPLGCKGKRGAAGCDQDALAALAKGLDAAPEDARVAMVAEGLLAACGEELPGLTRHYLRASLASPEERRELPLPPAKDPAVQASWGRLCEDFEGVQDRLRGVSMTQFGVVVFRHCDLQRFDLMSAEEAEALATLGWMTWTTHELLLRGGTPAEVARPISRALMRLEHMEFGPTLIQPLPGQRLVRLDSAGPIPPGLPIYASPTQIEVNEQRLASLKEGKLAPIDVQSHQIVALSHVLEEEAQKTRDVAEARGEAAQLRVLVVGDARLPFGTVVDILYTAGRAGFTDYAFVVETTFPVKRAIELATPRWGVEQPPALKVYIARDALHVFEAGDEAPRVFAELDPGAGEPDAEDLAKLAELAAAFGQRHPGAMAVVSADNEVSLQTLMTTYATLLGPDCEQREPDTCRFSKLVIEAGAG